MYAQRRDFLIGLFLLVGIGVVVGVLIITSGLGQVRYELFLRAASAEALTQDTRVVLQGLSVGRVRQVSPVLDSSNANVSFVARLAMQDRFPNGAQLRLPGGTRAVISQPTPIAPPVIELVLPERPPPGIYVQAGDTLNSVRPPDLLDALSGIVGDVNEGLKTALEDTRALVEHTTAAVSQAQRLMAETGPQLTALFQRLDGSLDRMDAVLTDLEPRLGPLQDTLAVTLADAHALLLRADTLVGTVNTIAVENKDVIRDAAALMLRAARILEHFSDQVSRRPTRLLTGVRPPPPDTTERPE